MATAGNCILAGAGPGDDDFEMIAAHDSNILQRIEPGPQDIGALLLQYGGSYIGSLTNHVPIALNYPLPSPMVEPMIQTRGTTTRPGFERVEKSNDTNARVSAKGSALAFSLASARRLYIRPRGQ